MEVITASVESAETPPAPTPRTFAAIHRDVWEVVRRAPAVFVLIPTLLWFLTGLVLEILTRDAEGDWLNQLQYYNRLVQIANAVIGTLVSAVFLAALTEMGLRRRVGTGLAFREGLALWGRLMGVYILMGLRVLLGLLLLILPGIYLLLRYSLAIPVAAFEGATGARALTASAEYMKGKYLRVALGVTGAALIYTPFFIAPLLLVPPTAGPWVMAAATVPGNVLVSFVTIALALIYVDARGETSFFAPVGTKAVDGAEWIPKTSRDPGRRGVATAVFTSALVVALAAGFWYWHALKPIADGDEAWGREAYEESLSHYTKAARWDPEDAYVQYSIGWCLVMLDRAADAEPHFDLAVQLEPRNLAYVVDHAQVLIALGKTSLAKSRLGVARRGGFENVELLDELEAQLDAQDD